MTLVLKLFQKLRFLHNRVIIDELRLLLLLTTTDTHDQFFSLISELHLARLGRYCTAFSINSLNLRTILKPRITDFGD